MSIIYQALKDLQPNEAGEPGVSQTSTTLQLPSGRRSRVRTLLLAAASLSGLLASAYWLFTNVDRLPKATSSAVAPLPPQASEQTPMALDPKQAQTIPDVAKPTQEGTNSERLSVLKKLLAQNAHPPRKTPENGARPEAPRKVAEQSAQRLVEESNTGTIVSLRNTEDDSFVSSNPAPTKVTHKVKLDSQPVPDPAMVKSMRQQILSLLYVNQTIEAREKLGQLKLMVGEQSPFLAKLTAYIDTKEGRLEQALDNYERALAFDSNDTSSQYNAALVAIKLQRFSSAKQYLLEAAKSAEYQVKARSLLNQLAKTEKADLGNGH